MELRITTLIENSPDDQNKLYYEHGLSLLVETDGKRILFDTGQSGDFLKNSEALNISLEGLDYVVISHGHYDHSGGFIKLVESAYQFLQLIVGDEFFQPKYKAVSEDGYKYNGNSFDEAFIDQNKISLKKVKEDMMYLTERLMIFHHFGKSTDFEIRNSKFFVKENTSFLPDEFDDEISLGIATEKGLVVIVGCSHVGIVNILNTISERINMPIYAVIGGTHLIDADEVRRKKTMEALKTMKIQLMGVSHCTGEEGIRCISQEFNEQFLINNTGNVIEI
jgi:7,8-dihydropterin-6-yl-methyl-4-(beta-D-ribofuranosyl)aminobenzene 5'-phosphate synthase